MNHEAPAEYRAAGMASAIALIGDGYRRLLGRPLGAGGEDPVAALWNAPAAIVAHGTGSDPLFFFGNRVALGLFECTPAQFAALPSRLSAEPLLRAERQALLDRVRRDGFISDYSGIRISATGRRFRIEQATVWNLIDGHGQPHGQAAAFTGWTKLD